MLYYKRTKGDDQHQKGIDTMKNTEKMTNAKALAFILENVDGLPTDVREKIENIHATYAKKSASVSSKPTKAQLEMLENMEKVLDFMEANKLYQCKDIVKLADLSSTQRASAIMNKLVAQGTVTKLTEKGNSYFQLVET